MSLHFDLLGFVLFFLQVSQYSKRRYNRTEKRRRRRRTFTLVRKRFLCVCVVVNEACLQIRRRTRLRRIRFPLLDFLNDPEEK